MRPRHEDKIVFDLLCCIQEQASDLEVKFEEFRSIHHALKHGDCLCANRLTGGLTNYSYKVYLKKSPEISLFAKISLPRALWDTSKESHYDVDRTRKEFSMMELFARLAPGHVPTPYVCQPLDEKMILLTQYCKNDEQLSQQLIKGVTDFRVWKGLAKSIAQLHCIDFDPEFNAGIRTTMLPTFKTLGNKLESMLDDISCASRTTKTVQELGQKKCQTLVDNIQYQYLNARDCLVHSDLHVKNILVERMSLNKKGHVFGPTGAFSVCDWEMGFAGPIGRDLGTLFAFPLCCALSHALNGNIGATCDILDCIELTWEMYAQTLREGGKDESFVGHAFCSIVGWCGRFMFQGFYTSGNHVEDFPVDNEKDKELLLDTVGVFGIKFMHWAFGESDDVIKKSGERFDMFKLSILHEIAIIISLKASIDSSYMSYGRELSCTRSDHSNGLRKLFRYPAGRSVSMDCGDISSSPYQ